MENQDITNIKLLITVGILIALFLAAIIILFVVYYQRKMLLKEARIKQIEQEKQIDLFRASVEAEEKQKEKIARNLHDEINPLLAVLKLNLSRHRIEVKKNTFHPDSLKTDSDMLDKAIEGIRTTCFDLVPSFLLQFGLLKSLEEYIRVVQQGDGMVAEFEDLTESGKAEVFSKPQQLNIYRICLEILNNLFKHSHCTSIKMSVEDNGRSLILEFKHNGKGITNEEMEVYTETSKGLGLKSLKARALILNARIDYRKHVPISSVKLSIPYSHD